MDNVAEAVRACVFKESHNGEGRDLHRKRDGRDLHPPEERCAPRRRDWWQLAAAAAGVACAGPADAGCERLGGGS